MPGYFPGSADAFGRPPLLGYPLRRFDAGARARRAGRKPAGAGLYYAGGNRLGFVSNGRG